MSRFRSLSRRELDVVSDLTWFALTTPPQREFRVQRILNQLGITAFCPQEWRWRRKSRYCKAKRRIDYPAYPRIVFVGVPQGRGLPWTTLSNIHLVTGFVARPDTMMPQVFATNDVIQVMKASKTPLFERPKEEAYEPPSFVPGEAVRIADGPLAGVELSVRKVVGHQVYCSVELLGREVEQELPAEVLELRSGC
jgi:transcription antitermination factor NusG